MSKHTPKGLKKAGKTKGKIAKKLSKGKVKIKKKNPIADEEFQPHESLD